MSGRLTEAERLVQVETNLSNLTDTVKAGFSSTGEAIKSIDTKLDNMATTFVTKDEFATYKASQNVQKVLLSVLMIIVGSLVGFFIATVTRGS